MLKKAHLYVVDMLIIAYICFTFIQRIYNKELTITMEQTTQNSNDLVLEKIQKLLNDAPHDWAERIAERMGKCAGSVYAYSTGVRGIRKGYHIEVLRQLTEMVKEKEREIKKLTA